MIHTLRQLLFFITFGIYTIIECAALDLPVKTVNGTKYLFYQVKAGETIFGVAKALGISREEIVLHNPAVSDGLKKGTVLYFPFETYASDEKRKTDAIEEKGGAEENSEATQPEIVQNRLMQESGRTAEVEKTAPSIVVMLPFMLDSEAQTRQSRFATEFYKGLLIAADTLCLNGDMVNIVAIDTKNDPDYVRTLLESDSRIKNASVIIAPEDDETLGIIASSSKGNNYHVLNLLNTKDSTYLYNPKVIQGNINHRLMYDKAVEALKKDFKDFTPVIIRNSSGIVEKEGFTSTVAGQYRLDGREIIEIDYDGTLLRSDLEFINDNPDKQYVIIPSSGTIQEFNKFSTTLKNIIESERNTEDIFNSGNRIAVFGYPDWLAFKGEARDMLHAIDATIFSRFSCDFISSATRRIAGSYNNWFGTHMSESIPAPAILGYDSGCYLIRNLRSNNGVFNPEKPTRFTGTQSTFMFRRPTDATDVGFCNEALYIIRYNPDSANLSSIVF